LLQAPLPPLSALPQPVTALAPRLAARKRALRALFARVRAQFAVFALAADPAVPWLAAAQA
jgi:hypothetical protein